MSLARQVRGWAGGTGLWRKIAIALAAAALASGVATYLALTGAPPFGPRPGVVLSLLYLDLVLLLLLVLFPFDGGCHWTVRKRNPRNGRGVDTRQHCCCDKRACDERAHGDQTPTMCSHTSPL